MRVEFSFTSLIDALYDQSIFSNLSEIRSLALHAPGDCLSLFLFSSLDPA